MMLETAPDSTACSHSGSRTTPRSGDGAGAQHPSRPSGAERQQWWPAPLLLVVSHGSHGKEHTASPQRRRHADTAAGRLMPSQEHSTAGTTFRDIDVISSTVRGVQGAGTASPATNAAADRGTEEGVGAARQATAADVVTPVEGVLVVEAVQIVVMGVVQRRVGRSGGAIPQAETSAAHCMEHNKQKWWARFKQPGYSG